MDIIERRVALLKLKTADMQTLMDNCPTADNFVFKANWLAQVERTTKQMQEIVDGKHDS